MAIPDAKTIEAFTWHWQSLMGVGRVAAGTHLRPLERIVEAYSQSHRHYHTLDHIVHILDMLMMRHQAAPHHQRLALDLAAVFHDVVYDPRRSDNEERSAEIADAALVELGLAGLTERVGRWIRMTKDHRAPEDDIDGQLLMDADLAILGMGPAAYADYSKAIRREYEWVEELAYLHGRRKVLSEFLDRSAIFKTESFQQWEKPARANLAAEIAQIDEKLRTLAS